MEEGDAMKMTTTVTTVKKRLNGVMSNIDKFSELTCSVCVSKETWLRSMKRRR